MYNGISFSITFVIKKGKIQEKKENKNPRHMNLPRLHSFQGKKFSREKINIYLFFNAFILFFYLIFFHGMIIIVIF